MAAAGVARDAALSTHLASTTTKLRDIHASLDTGLAAAVAHMDAAATAVETMVNEQATAAVTAERNFMTGFSTLLSEMTSATTGVAAHAAVAIRASTMHAVEAVTQVRGVGAAAVALVGSEASAFVAADAHAAGAACAALESGLAEAAAATTAIGVAAGNVSVAALSAANATSGIVASLGCARAEAATVGTASCAEFVRAAASAAAAAAESSKLAARVLCETTAAMHSGSRLAVNDFSAEVRPLCFSLICKCALCRRRQLSRQPLSMLGALLRAPGVLAHMSTNLWGRVWDARFQPGLPLRSATIQRQSVFLLRHRTNGCLGGQWSCVTQGCQLLRHRYSLLAQLLTPRIPQRCQ